MSYINSLNKMDVVVVRLILKNPETDQDTIITKCQEIGIECESNIIQKNAFDYILFFTSMNEATREELRVYLLSMYVTSRVSKMSFNIV